MRNSTKNQLIEMTDTIQEAVSYLMSNPEDKDDIYGLVITFIKTINNAAQPYSADIVPHGEVLIEELTKTLDVDGGDSERLWKSLDDYRCVLYNIKPKYKVVFLSCYESTWDSLESVYEEFLADSDFIVDVIIVPIARNAVGGAKLVYEDYLTPHGIPNTKYTEYDITADKPDIVFFNNPYNDTMPKSYNTDYLKLHTGLLVYIPYFLYNHLYHVQEEIGKIAMSYAGMRSHVDCDIFVAQSETYINTIGTVANNAEKMVALGNPKVDRLLRGKESGKWPRYKNWEEKISGKTVFMLNTHFSLFTAKRLFFMWEHLIFPIFKFIEENDNTALIWRPHPQYKIVGISLEKHQEEQVYAHLKKAKSSDRMILDETGASLSALMYCDALLSNSSSIVGEALVLDKPVFLFGVDPREDNISYEKFAAMVEKGEFKDLWDITHTIDEKNIFVTQAVGRAGLNRDYELKFRGEVKDIYYRRKEIFAQKVLEFLRNTCLKRDDYIDVRNLYRNQERFNASNAKGISNHIKNFLMKG